MVGHQAQISQTDLDLIRSASLAQLTLSSTGGTLTADGTEQTIYIENEPLGCWAPRIMLVDLDNMAAGDTIVLRVYYRISDGGDLQLLDAQSFTGIDGSLANGAKLVDIHLNENRHGFKMTLEQTAGTNRAFAWELSVEV